MQKRLRFYQLTTRLDCVLVMGIQTRMPRTIWRMEADTSGLTVASMSRGMGIGVKHLNSPALSGKLSGDLSIGW